MRNGQNNNNNKRMRNNNRSSNNNSNNNNNNNNNNNRRGQNPMTRVYESNGPDIKIRGTASHIAEKYLQLARDSRTSSDPVAAENYYQHAEHYFRLIATAQEQFRQNQPQQQQRADNGANSDMQMEDGEDESENFSNFGAEPGFVPQQREQNPPREQHQPRENYQPRGEQPYPREARQPQPQPQPQPQYQPQPQPQPAVQATENIGLPSFITGGAPQPATGAPVDPNGGNAAGEPRFPPRRRRRPHGPRADAAAAPAAVGEDFNPGNS